MNYRFLAVAVLATTFTFTGMSPALADSEPTAPDASTTESPIATAGPEPRPRDLGDDMRFRNPVIVAQAVSDFPSKRVVMRIASTFKSYNAGSPYVLQWQAIALPVPASGRCEDVTGWPSQTELETGRRIVRLGAVTLHGTDPGPSTGTYSVPSFDVAKAKKGTPACYGTRARVARERYGDLVGRSAWSKPRLVRADPAARKPAVVFVKQTATDSASRRVTKALRATFKVTGTVRGQGLRLQWEAVDLPLPKSGRCSDIKRWPSERRLLDGQQLMNFGSPRLTKPRTFNLPRLELWDGPESRPVCIGFRARLATFDDESGEFTGRSKWTAPRMVAARLDATGC